MSTQQFESARSARKTKWTAQHPSQPLPPTLTNAREARRLAAAGGHFL